MECICSIVGSADKVGHSRESEAAQYLLVPYMEFPPHCIYYRQQLSGVKHCVGRYAYFRKQDAVYISAHFHVGDTQAGLGSSQGDNLAFRVLLYLLAFPILSVPSVQLMNETSLRPIQVLSPSCIDEISERYPAVFIQIIVDVSGTLLYFEPAVS